MLKGSEESLDAATRGTAPHSPSKSTTSIAKKDIWALIKERNAQEKKGEGLFTYLHRLTLNKVESAVESTILLVGGKGSGKSSLIVRFLDRGRSSFNPLITYRGIQDFHSRA